MNFRYTIVSLVSLSIGFGLGVLSSGDGQRYTSSDGAGPGSASGRNLGSSGRSHRESSELSKSRSPQNTSGSDRETTIASRWPRSDFKLIGRDGLPNRFALDKAGLDDGQYLKVQEIWGKFVDSVEQLVAENSVENPLLSDKENGVVVYDIRPFSDEGLANLEALEQRFSSEFGSDSAKILMSGVDLQNFGGYGRYETQVKFFDGAHDSGMDDRETKIVITKRNPKTGKMVSETTTTNLATLKRNLGEAFVEISE